MALNRVHPAAVAALLVFVALGVGQAAANFAASPGFSGKNGATCTACHTVAPVGSTPATAVFQGLPEAWVPGATYSLTLRVEGGPLAKPAPQPQGGFDLASDGGRFQLQAGTETLFHLVGDQEATYRPAGTMMREWHVDWVAPDLAVRPAPVRFWLAVLAADGNHVVATNTSDGGERFDSVAALTAMVPPSSAASAAWNALPLLSPTAQASRASNGWEVAGRHGDGNATTIAFRLDTGAWERRDTAASWHLAFPGLSGVHTLTIQSEGAGRASPPLVIALPGSGDAVVGATQSKSTPATLALPLLAFAFALLARRPVP